MAKSKKKISRKHKVRKGYFLKKIDFTTLYESIKISFLNNIPIIAVAAVYTGVMMFLSLKYHRIGGYEVEADFYADFVVQTKKLLAGNFSPKNFGLKGPVYYICLAMFHLIFGEFFRAGLIMNVLTAGGVAFIIMLIIKNLFGTRESVLAAIFTISTFAFLHYTYSVGTDMLMCLFSFIAIYFLLTKNHTTQSLVLAGLFACLAFLTRYNAVFVYFGGIATIYLTKYNNHGIKKVLKNCGIFLGSSVFFGLPWYIPNTIVNGSPIHNDNIIVLKLNYYKEIMWYQPERLESIKTLKDLIMFKPTYFFNKTVSNVINFFKSDIYELLGFYFSLMVLAGVIILLILLVMKHIRFSGPQQAFFIFPFLNFAILAFVSYNVRFSFFRIPFYAILLTIPLIYLIHLIAKITGKRAVGHGLFILCLFLFLFKFYPGYRKIIEHHKKYPDQVFIFDYADVIKKHNLDESYSVISTKPHLSYYSGLRAVMFPININTLEKLYEYAKENRAKFLLMSANEYIHRKNFRFLADKYGKYPGFTPVKVSKFGVLYHIDIP